ncbi:hypothetical protein AJ88_28820 [Mesorhizobium amorphae CCBAU 01583]|nr:hypothetical protein AJ88_28820 [Mesorhizobium amorphae CCBAU 01583]
MIASGETLQAVDGDENVGTPRFFSSFMTRSHNLAPSVCLIQSEAEDLLGAVGQYAERDVYRLVANEALVPDLDPDRVEEDERIDRIERPFSHSATSSRTASVTAEIKSGETSMP